MKWLKRLVTRKKVTPDYLGIRLDETGKILPPERAGVQVKGFNNDTGLAELLRLLGGRK